MQHQHNVFHERKSLGEICVEDDGKEAYEENKQRRVPPLKNIRGVVYDNQALDLGRCEECDAGDTRLPAKNAYPSRHIAEKLLPAGRRKLGNPVVLSASGRRHGRHFGHGGNDGEEADKGAEIAVYQARSSAVYDAKSARAVGVVFVSMVMLSGPIGVLTQKKEAQQINQSITTHVSCPSQVFIKIQVKPSMDKNPKLRCRVS